MKLNRKRELKNIILSHIARTIRGEMQEWDRVEGWLSFKFCNNSERDLAADMFETEAKRLCSRIG